MQGAALVGGDVIGLVALDLVLRFLRRSAAPVALVVEVGGVDRSEEHTSELQSRFDLVCRLLLGLSPPARYALSLHDALPIWPVPADDDATGVDLFFILRRSDAGRCPCGRRCDRSCRS